MGGGCISSGSRVPLVSVINTHKQTHRPKRATVVHVIVFSSGKTPVPSISRFMFSQ